MTKPASVRRERITVRLSPIAARWLKSKSILEEKTLSRATGEVLEEACKKAERAFKRTTL